MSPAKRFRRRQVSGGVVLDEFGGTPDGGLAIVTADGTTVHRTTPRVAASLRYFLAKTRGPSPDGFPERLAITAALRGEGVSFTARSIASLLAYDSDSSVVVVDLNWTNPARVGTSGKSGKSRRRRDPAPIGETTGSEPSAAVNAALARLEAQKERDWVASDGNERRVDVVGSGRATRARNRKRGSAVRDTTGRLVPQGNGAAAEAAAHAQPPSAAAGVGDPALPSATDPMLDPELSPELDAGSGSGAGDEPEADTDTETIPDGAIGESDSLDDAGTLTLVDALDWGLPVDEILVATANPRLSLINAGGLSVSRRPVVAGSKALEDVIGEVADRFDHVLLDVPPVLASSDAIRLSQLAESFVLVVRHGVTTRRQVEAALDELSGIDPLGVIINRYESRVPPFLRRLVGA